MLTVTSNDIQLIAALWPPRQENSKLLFHFCYEGGNVKAFWKAI